MIYEAKCACGSNIHLEDRGVFINAGGKPDEKGRIYIFERIFDEWLENHKMCKRLEQSNVK